MGASRYPSPPTAQVPESDLERANSDTCLVCMTGLFKRLRRETKLSRTILSQKAEASAGNDGIKDAVEEPSSPARLVPSPDCDQACESDLEREAVSRNDPSSAKDDSDGSCSKEAELMVPAGVAVPWANTWLMRMISLFQRIRRESQPKGAIQCASYFAALDEMSGVYDLFFSVAVVRNEMKRDMVNHLGEVKERLAAAGMDAETTTLRTLLEHDVKLLGVDQIRWHRQRSAVWGLLWINRASHFIFTFLRELIQGKSGKDAVDAAYKTLSVYHGLLTRKFVSMAMAVAPMKREDIIMKIGLPDESVTLREGGTFLALGEVVVHDITAMMDELGTNFPDRV